MGARPRGVRGADGSGAAAAARDGPRAALQREARPPAGRHPGPPAAPGAATGKSRNLKHVPLLDRMDTDLMLSECVVHDKALVPS